MKGGIISKNKFEYIAVDILGPLKCKHFKNKRKEEMFYIVVIIDIASRWCEIDIVYNIKTEQIIKSIQEQYINKHGTPSKILTDQGRQFISTAFQQFVNQKGIKHILTNAYNPTANSIVERANGSIGNIARIPENLSLTELKNNILQYMNYTANRTTGMTPFEIVHGYNPFDIQKIKKNEVEKKLFELTQKSITREEEKINKKKSHMSTKLMKERIKENMTQTIRGQMGRTSYSA